MNKKNPIFYGILILIAINLLFKMPFVEKRIHLDEEIWNQTGVEFMEAVSSEKWKDTRLSTRPGVTVEWIVGIDSLVYYKIHPDYSVITFKSKTPGRSYVQTEYAFNPAAQLAIRGFAVLNRIVFIFFWILFSVLIFYLLQKIFDFKIAVASSILLALYPALNSFSDIVWTDVMLMWLQLGSVLCFVIFIKNSRKKFLYFSGIFFGLALLTKMIAWLIPALLLVILLAEKKINKEQIKNIFKVVGTGVFVFYALYPASWFNPYLIFDRASEVSLVEKSHSFDIFYYPYLMLRNDPALVILALFLLLTIIRDKIKLGNKAVFFGYIFSFYLLVLTLVHFLKDSQVESIASPRYYLPAIPFLVIFFVHCAYSFAGNPRYRLVYYFPLALACLYAFKNILDLYLEITRVNFYGL